MVKIYVARHGQDVDNANGILNGHRDEPLTDLGREQAKDVARKMVKAGMRLSSSSSPTATPAADASCSTRATVLKAIYSSPLQRARETAEIFANMLSASTGEKKNEAKVEIMYDLIERNFGVLTGQPASSILDICSAEDILVTEKIHYFLQPPGAETFPELIERANKLLTHIQKITEANDGNDSSSSSTSVLLVTHGDFGKMLYAAYYNLQWEEVLRQFHFGNSEVLLLAEDSPPENAHVFDSFQFNS